MMCDAHLMCTQGYCGGERGGTVPLFYIADVCHIMHNSCFVNLCNLHIHVCGFRTIYLH